MTALTRSPIVQVVSGLVADSQSAATANRVAINAAITSVNSLGGGTVFIPRGTYYVNGTGTASDGCIKVKSYTHLTGAGMGVTIIKLIDNSAADITGIIRTPSGEVTQEFSITNLSVDGNDANNTVTVKGVYLGVSPSHRCTVSVSGTTGTVTTYNDAGTATRSHGLVTNDVIFLTNDTNEGLRGDFTFTKTSNTAGTITVAAGTSSDLVGYTWYYDDAFADIADKDFLIERVEVYNCQDYGFDPHERCIRGTFRHCYAHDNGTSSDGFTFDGVWDCTIEDCYSFSNGRHGFNIITGSGNLRFVNCEAYSNGQYGFAVQRGSTSNGSGTIQKTQDVGFSRCISRDNTQYGFRIVMAKKCSVVDCHSFNNGRDGIRLEGSTQCIVANNQIHDNGQTTTNTYPEIYALQYALTIYDIGAAGNSVQTYGATYNIIVDNNIDSALLKKANYSGLEADDASDYNHWINNRVVTAGATGSISVPSGNADSAILGATNYDNVWRLVDNADATKQLAFDPSGITTATTRTVTIPNANGTMAYLTKAGEAAFSNTLTWTGAGNTPPSGSTNNYYWWQQVGQMVTFQIRLEYSVQGANVTGVDIDLPSDVPTPKDITGVADTEVIINGAALMTTSITTSGASGRCALFKQTGAANGYRLQLLGFTAGSYLGVFATVTYLANTSLQ